MPFDALLVPARPRPLAAVLEEHGAEPVAFDVLAAHKRAQLERFAPSFWHQHQTWLPIGLTGSVGCMAASGGIANALLPGSLLSSWLSLSWLSVLGLLVLFGVFRVNAGAAWQEREIAPERLGQFGVPAEIARLARILCWNLPNATLILGELVQEEVVLDPYLLLQWQDQRVCLGIWDGATIFASA
jgi:hypothetical protein